MASRDDVALASPLPSRECSHVRLNEKGGGTCDRDGVGISFAASRLSAVMVFC